MAQLVARLNGIQKAEGSNPFNSTRKGLSEHRRIKKRYSDSFYFRLNVKRWDLKYKISQYNIFEYQNLFISRNIKEYVF